MRSETAHLDSAPKSRPRYTYLLFALLLVIIWPMVFGNSFPVVGEVLFSAIIVTGLMALRRSRAFLAFAVLLGSAMLVPLWAQRFDGFVHAAEARAITAVLFFLLLTVAILTHIARMRRIRFDTISGSMCAYLLIGLMWAHLYLLVQVVHLHQDPFGLWAGPAPPEMNDEFIRATLNTFVYFSFVTLTTLGYGDITPAIDVARGLCILEAITGQLYLAVMVSGLVGLHIAERLRGKGPSDSASDD